MGERAKFGIRQGKLEDCTEINSRDLSLSHCEETYSMSQSKKLIIIYLYHFVLTLTPNKNGEPLQVSVQSRGEGSSATVGRQGVS